MKVCLRENAIIFSLQFFTRNFTLNFTHVSRALSPAVQNFAFLLLWGCTWALLGAPRLSWALLGFPGLPWVPPGAPGSWALLGFPGFSWVLLGIPGSSWVLLGFPAWALLGAPGLSWALLGFPGLSPGLSPGLLSAALFFAQFFTDSSGEDAVQKGAWRRQRGSILIARFFHILRVRLFQQRSRFITPSSRF